MSTFTADQFRAEADLYRAVDLPFAAMLDFAATLVEERATCRCPDQSYADKEIARLSQEIDRLTQEKRSHDEAGEGCAWYDFAKQLSNDVEFWRGLVLRCGEVFGVEARTADDGSVADSVLALKVPELVERQSQEIATLRQAQTKLITFCEDGAKSPSDHEAGAYLNVLEKLR